MKFLSIVVIILASATFTLAQEQNVSDKEKEKQGLVLDQTTPDEAIKFLGTPKSDKLDKLKIQKIDKWVSSKQNEKIFRILTFEKAQGMDKITLAFSDEKLVMIHFNLDKKIPARDLSRVYQIAFIPIFSELDDNFHPADYEKRKGNVDVADFPENYYLIAASKNSFISARVFNGENAPKPPAGGVVRKADTRGNVKVHTNPLLGQVTEIQIISRKMEK